MQSPVSTAVIDAHAHCGVIDRRTAQRPEDYIAEIAGTDIGGAVFFPPVSEIYDRYDPGFDDTPDWRRRRTESNAYLLAISPPGLTVYPYFFVWNDFAVDQLTGGHCGVKWHRHGDEPAYRYDDPRCAAAIDEIRRRKLPVVLEEELENTVRFVRELACGVTVIIPHLGMLNGGFSTLAEAGLWEEKNVWADTALAPGPEIREYVRRYGHSRLLFGSDFPFGNPAAELDRIRRMGFSPATEAAVTGGNFLHLQSQIPGSS